jgi:hypothetical protein
MNNELVKSEEDLKYLYKYRSLLNHKKVNKNTLRMIYDGEIYFSNADNFNDPFECSVDVSCEATKDEVIAHLQKNENTPAKNQRLFELWLNDKEAFKNAFDNIMPDHTRKIFLIFCLAKYYDNILMWSHYANDHKGICIGYKTTDFANRKTIKCGIENLNTGMHPFPYLPLIKVEYANEKPKEFNMIKEDVNSLFAFIYTKAKLWEYENEYRIILNRDALKKNPIHIDQGEIKEILFGLRTDTKMQDEIINTILSKRTDIKFYKMNAIKGKYALTRELINI